MGNQDFKKNFAMLLKKAGDRAEMVVRKTALELQTSMVQMSPVGDPSGWNPPNSAPPGYVGGRFKNNWACGVGVVNTDTSAAEDKTGAGAIGRTATALPAWKPGQTIWLANSLPYAAKLEHGWSKQAPAGMVKLTVQNYAQALAEAVKGLP